MTRKFFVVIAVLALTGLAALAQSKPSIQGVWRPVEVTITNPHPAPGGLPKGTHTNFQPALLIFTGKHYSTIYRHGGETTSVDGFQGGCAMKVCTATLAGVFDDMPQMNDVLASTVEVDQQRTPKEPGGAINGGLVERPKEAPNGLFQGQ